MSTDNFGALGADFFIKTFNKGSSMSQADLDALVQYVQLTSTIMAIGDFTPNEQDSVWMILERVDVPSAPGYTVTNNTEVTMTSGGMVTIDSIPWTKVTGKPTLFTANQTLNTSDSVSFNRLTVTGASGIEGGEIELAKAPNSTIAGNVIIDVYENKLRFFEGGGNGRGFYLDLTTGANNTSTNIMSGGDGADGADGAPGQGVPTGGTVGQVLAKIDGTDYSTEWVDQATTSVFNTGTTRSISGEYGVSDSSGTTVVAGGTGTGTNMFYWGSNGSIADCTALIDALASSLGITVAGLIGTNVSSPNMVGGATIVGIGYTDRGDGTFTPVCWISGEITSSTSGVATFGGGLTFQDNTVQTTAYTGEHDHEAYEITNTSASGTTHSVSVGTDGMISFPVIDGERTLWGAVDEDFNIKTTRTEPGIDADISILSADDIWMEAGDDIDLKADGTVRITSDNAAAGPQWSFGTAGNITLPAGGTISEGGGLTGAIRLTPAGGANEYQALVIYPTDGDGDHIHLTAGGGTTDLYLGSDLQYVQIQHSGHVVVQAADGVDYGQWLFNKNGSLTFPDNTISTGKGITIPVDQSLTVNLSASGPGPEGLNNTFKINPESIKLPNGNGVIFAGDETAANEWDLDSSNKRLSFPDAGDGVYPKILYSDPINDGIGMELLTLAKSIKITAASNKSWTFGTDGDLTAPGNLQVDGGKIILNSAGNAYVESVDYGVNSANSAVNIFGGPYQKIKLRAGFGTEATWTFGTDGDLTAPRNIILNNPVTTVTETETGTIADSNANPFTFRILKSANPQLVIPFADPNFVLKWTAGDAGSLAAAAQAPGGHGVSSLVSDDGTYWNFNSWYGLGGNRPNTGTVFTVEYGVVDSDTTISTTETNLVIEADTKQYKFGTDGNITLPAGGDIVDSTGATAFVSLATLKQVVAMSTDFDDFRTRIAGM